MAGGTRLIERSMAKTQSPYPYKACHRFVRMSVLKVRPVLDLIRGKFADDAMLTLKYLPNRSARFTEKVLKSAMKNAEVQGIREPGSLVVVDARGDGASMIKRLMPRARGMAHLIKKRMCHITIGLTDLQSSIYGLPEDGYSFAPPPDQEGFDPDQDEGADQDEGGEQYHEDDQEVAAPEASSSSSIEADTSESDPTPETERVAEPETVRVEGDAEGELTQDEDVSTSSTDISEDTSEDKHKS